MHSFETIYHKGIIWDFFFFLKVSFPLILFEFDYVVLGQIHKAPVDQSQQAPTEFILARVPMRIWDPLLFLLIKRLKISR